jgi:hypothetical protein
MTVNVSCNVTTCKFDVHGSVHLGNVYAQLKVQLDVLFMYSLFLSVF